jgi:hypothetical protein
MVQSIRVRLTPELVENICKFYAEHSGHVGLGRFCHKSYAFIVTPFFRPTGIMFKIFKLL